MRELLGKQVINSEESRLLISELQSQLGTLAGSVSLLTSRVALLPPNIPQEGATPQAVNQIRNGTFSHSVNSWDDVVAANDGRYECAWWYSHPFVPNQPMFKGNNILGDATLTLGTVDAGADTIEIVGHGLATGVAFVLSGSVPAPLSTAVVYYAIVIDADTIKVAASFADAIAGTAIGLTNTTTGGDLEFNYTLKTEDHTEYDPNTADWDIPTGSARLSDDWDLSAFFPGSNIEPGYSYYPSFSIVKQNKWVWALPEVRIACGLYGESTADGWDWLGAPYEITATVLGTVGTPTSRDYRILAKTNRGFTIRSSVLTVANAPSDADFAAGARVFLSWPRVLNYGVIGYEVYRLTGAVYDLLFETSAGQPQYIDNNSFQSTPVGWPSADFERLVAYTASSPNLIANLGYAGDPNNIGWSSLPFAVKVAQNYDRGDTDTDSGQWVRWALTGQLDYNVPFCVTTLNSPSITNAEGPFTPEMVGCVIETYSKNGDLAPPAFPYGDVTIGAYISATEVEIVVPGFPLGYPFQGDNAVRMYIYNGAPAHSLSVDLAHVTYAQGATFSPNPEDISPERGSPAAVPNGTTQDGPQLPQAPGDPDGTPPYCLYEKEMVPTDRGEMEAIHLERGMLVSDGEQQNVVVDKQLGVADVWFIETANGCTLMASATKKIFINDEESVALEFLDVGDNVVTQLKTRTLSPIAVKHKMFENAVVVKLSLAPGHKFLAGTKGKILVSNRKPDPDLLPQQV